MMFPLPLFSCCLFVEEARSLVLSDSPIGDLADPVSLVVFEMSFHSQCFYKLMETERLSQTQRLVLYSENVFRRCIKPRSKALGGHRVQVLPAFSVLYEVAHQAGAVVGDQCPDLGFHPRLQSCDAQIWPFPLFRAGIIL